MHQNHIGLKQLHSRAHRICMCDGVGPYYTGELSDVSIALYEHPSFSPMHLIHNECIVVSEEPFLVHA
jgi:hypothetical protein